MKMREEEIAKKLKETGPKMRWFDSVTDDLVALGVRNWRRKSQERQTWKRIVEDARAVIIQKYHNNKIERRPHWYMELCNRLNNILPDGKGPNDRVCFTWPPYFHIFHPLRRAISTFR
ncbi:hypothetical protein C0J52_21978 [Blattella germanica]|nr:hypothetical protein C0J52_21978 [Blattella germanica]